VSAAYGQFWEFLHFTDGFEPMLNQQTVVATAGHYWKNGWNLSLSGGAIVAGRLEGAGEKYVVDPGWLASIRAGVELVHERGAIPFLELGLALSVSRATIRGEGQGTHALWATDAQLSLVVGYTLFDFWRLYLAPRAFGGPIFTDHDGAQVRGRDRYFFMAGLGTAFLLPAGITIFVDGSPLGERAITGGLAVTF
jgi:hypothetical protein